MGTATQQAACCTTQIWKLTERGTSERSASERISAKIELNSGAHDQRTRQTG